MCVRSCLTLCHPMNCSSPASLSMEFSRQEYWSGLPFSPPGDVPDPQIIPESPVSPAQERGFFTTEPRGLSCCPSKKTPEHMCPATSRYRVTRWTPGARKWGITWDQPCSHFDYGLRKWTLVVKTPSLWDFRGGPMIKTALPLQGASIWYLVGKLRSRVPHLWNSVLAPGFPTDSGSKESAHNAGDVGSIPESGRSLEEEMATHSTSFLAWRIPWTEEPGGLQSRGLQRTGRLTLSLSVATQTKPKHPLSLSNTNP